MKDHGWDIVGVYPKAHEKEEFPIMTLSQKFLLNIENLLTYSEPQPYSGLVDEILDLGGVEVIWLQLGIENPHAELRAEKEGIRVISNRCLIIEHRKYF